MRLFLPLLLFAAGCGQPEPSPVEPEPYPAEDGLALATETYHRYLATGVPSEIFGVTVIKRGDYFIQLLGPPQYGWYRVPMPSDTDRRPAPERAREARTGTNWRVISDSAAVARLTVVVGTFEQTNLHALSSASDGSFAVFRVTPHDALRYYRSGVDPDTVRGNSTHRELIADRWMYSRNGNSHDGT